MISAVATRSQTGAPQVPTVAIDPLGRVTQGARHKGPVDGIGQSRLPMTFGLADVIANLPQRTPCSNDTKEGVVKSLALKVLQVPLFSGAQLLSRPSHNLSANGRAATSWDTGVTNRDLGASHRATRG